MDNDKHGTWYATALLLPDAREKLLKHLYAVFQNADVHVLVGGVKGAVVGDHSQHDGVGPDNLLESSQNGDTATFTQVNKGVACDAFNALVYFSEDAGKGIFFGIQFFG